MIFTYPKLLGFLVEARRRVGVWRMCDWADQPGLILRHDVDLDVWPARQVANVELAAEVRSSFFFLTTSETYNIASARNRALLRSLTRDGFEVGLHFDPTVYDMSSESTLADAVRREADILSDISGEAVRSISLHNPSEYGVFPMFDGFINAYDPRLFSPDRYLSDSRLQFQINPWEFLDRARHDVVQLLLHPLHYAETGRTYPTPMVEYLERQVDVVHSIFSVNSEYRARCSDGLREALRRAMHRPQTATPGPSSGNGAASTLAEDRGPR